MVRARRSKFFPVIMLCNSSAESLLTTPFIRCCNSWLQFELLSDFWAFPRRLHEVQERWQNGIKSAPSDTHQLPLPALPQHKCPRVVRSLAVASPMRAETIELRALSIVIPLPQPAELHQGAEGTKTISKSAMEASLSPSVTESSSDKVTTYPGFTRVAPVSLVTCLYLRMGTQKSQMVTMIKPLSLTIK